MTETIRTSVASRAWSWVILVKKRRDELLEEARQRREMAARVRRLARGLSLNDDHDRMMRQADQMEAEAHRLERQAHDDGDQTAGPSPAPGQPLRQEQVQQQQQQNGIPAKPKP